MPLWCVVWCAATHREVHVKICKNEMKHEDNNGNGNQFSWSRCAKPCSWPNWNKLEREESENQFRREPKSGKRCVERLTGVGDHKLVSVNMVCLTAILCRCWMWVTLHRHFSLANYSHIIFTVPPVRYIDCGRRSNHNRIFDVLFIQRIYNAVPISRSMTSRTINAIN